MLDSLYKFKNHLNKQGVFFCFSGPISQSLMVEIGDTLEQKMRLEEASQSTISGVFSVVIEGVQNIIHYSDEKAPASMLGFNEGEFSVGIVAIGYEDDHYFVTCGNMIKNNKISAFRNRLMNLQNMNKEEIKRFYKEQRRKETQEGSKGAGLGFIELAKRSIKPIDFNFENIDNDFSFFSFVIVI
ncbi:MAG: hypothetical protein HQK79_06805 [Desulfobacterales bacterium]|nr:hypothetical protein [Desulfobacterales bacterium]MBF0396825.1 hypothetical protein [Desulfobacterales bacterium]